MEWGAYEERTIDLKNRSQVESIRSFLANFNLDYSSQSADYTMALYKDDAVVATGSLGGEVLRNVAVDPALQGEGLTAIVVGHLMREAGRRGVFHYFIFTKPEKAHLFSELGFKELVRVEPYAVLLESGMGSVQEYCRDLKAKVAHLPDGSRASLVMNCNPFTLGHKAVIEKAARENNSVVVQIVSEDRSLFPFAARMRLVQEGTAEFNNVAVLPAGKYTISAATFPGYFTRGDQTVLAQTRLDAAIYAKYIAPALRITKRYVGEEPYCDVTKVYNEALADILPQYGISLVIMNRLAVDNAAISASYVRELIREEKWEQIRKLVPDTTYQYLISAEAATIIDKIKQSISRH